MDTQADLDFSDVQVPNAAKFATESISDSNLGTNYSKNRHSANKNAAVAKSQDLSAYHNRKVAKASKRGKLVKMNYDGRDLTPHMLMQFSADLTGSKAKRGAPGSR